MDEKEFNGLWDKIALKEISKITALYKSNGLRTEQREKNTNSFKKNVYSRYECERANFRSRAKIKDDDLLDRHKVAALFYVAFVDKDSNEKGKAEFPFIVYDSKNYRLNDLDATITHEAAFNIARGIMESFILSDSEIDSGYREYINKNGMIEPELICFSKNDNTNYKEEVLKLLIYTQRERKLSVAQLSILFSSIENNTLVNYRHSFPLSSTQFYR